MDQRIKELFKKYQQGTASPQERSLVETWFESHYGQQGRKLSRNEESSVFEDLDARINSFLTAETPVTEEDIPVRKMNFHWLRVAAVFFTLLVSGIYVRNKYAKKSVPETFTEITTQRGAKKEITLQDGTTVFLNSGSSVAVSSEFGQTKREIKLTGEAFFEVHHDAKRPFIIHTGKLLTTVLGTSFNIKAYPEDEQLKVSVATGKVSVQRSGALQPYTKSLTHNQALVYNSVKNSHLITTVNTDSISSWRSNHLVFDNASYEEIARTLGRWYNLDVQLAAHSSTKKYTLSFYNEPIDKVLNVLSSLTGMTYRVNGTTVIIKPSKP